MISTYYFFFIALNLLHYSHSLQSGYTCETSVTLKCHPSRTIVILEVTYSSECPRIDKELNGTSIYAPSRCIGYYRERASTECNGKDSCTINNDLDQRPAFLIGQQANCAFKGQSINIEYSCIPDFYSSKLPRIDICSLQSLDDIKEGFIHTPNYPDNYPNNLTCLKKVPKPNAAHRLKIYALNFDIESVTVSRFTNTINLNDWLEINDNEEKLYGTRAPYTLLFDDVIDASLKFKTNLANTKRSYNGFLLYFIVTPVRPSQPPTTTKLTTTTSFESSSDEDSAIIIQEKSAALLKTTRRENNVGLLLLVILLSGILFTILCGILLYKRRNDRRIRYLTETFNSFKPKRSKSITLHSSENTTESELNSKLNLSSTSTSDKFIAKDKKEEFQNFDHIYSEDPLQYKNSDNSPIYEYIPYETIYQQIVKPNRSTV